MFKVKNKVFTPHLMNAIAPIASLKFPGWNVKNISSLLKEIRQAAYNFQKDGHKLASKYLKEGTKGEHGEIMFTPVLKDGAPVSNLFEGKEEGFGEKFKEEYEALEEKEIEFNSVKIHENMLQKAELTVIEYTLLEPFITIK